MKIGSKRDGMIRLLVFTVLMVAPLGFAMAGPVSPWSADGNAAIRLMAGRPQAGSGTLLAGLEIRLDPGWKTYWKVPGDSGVPPRFDWSGSDNVASVEPLFPAPKRLADGAGWAIGYDSSLVVPLRVTPKDAARPVTLELTLDYAVCEKLCVPARGTASLTHAPDSDIDRFAAADIERFLKRTPRRASLGDGGKPSVTAERLADGAFRVAVAATDARTVDLFASSDSVWAPPLPELEGRDAEGRHLFRVSARKAPAGTSVTLVAVADDSVVEIILPLDDAPPKP